jgi:hypothetical protein
MAYYEMAARDRSRFADARSGSTVPARQRRARRHRLSRSTAR